MPSRAIHSLETHFFGSAPSLKTVLHPSGWLLRSSGGYTKRGNSASPLNPLTPLNETLLKEIRGDLMMPNVIRITPLAHPGDDQFLEAKGWERLDPSIVMIRELDTSVQTTHGTNNRIQTSSEPTSDWINGFASSSSLSPSHTATFRSTLDLIRPPFFPTYLTLFDPSDNTVAVGYGQAVISNGIAGLYDIVVPPSYRGKGYGRAVTLALLAEVKRAGARTAYLQVTERNGVGKRLYRSLGFKEVYRYHYRIATQANVSER